MESVRLEDAMVRQGSTYTRQETKKSKRTAQFIQETLMEGTGSNEKDKNLMMSSQEISSPEPDSRRKFGKYKTQELSEEDEVVGELDDGTLLPSPLKKYYTRKSSGNSKQHYFKMSDEESKEI